MAKFADTPLIFPARRLANCAIEDWGWGCSPPSNPWPGDNLIESRMVKMIFVLELVNVKDIHQKSGGQTIFSWKWGFSMSKSRHELIR